MIFLEIFFGIFFLVNIIFLLKIVFIQDNIILDKSKNPLNISQKVSLKISPKISILVAARNEEKNILRCLKSLQNLDYPKEKLQILIGNDASDDDTAQIIKDFIAENNSENSVENNLKNSHFELVEITENIANLKGKTNVLAQLAHFANGDYFFFTDADISVPHTWINGMLDVLKLDENTTKNTSQSKEIGIITGFTLIEGDDIFHHLQSLDWSLALGMVRAFGTFDMPVTSMGNNMAVSRKAYENCGGYEKIGFSLVEDFALFRAIIDKGFSFKNLISKQITAFSTPILSFAKLMEQRKRWLFGVLKVPIYMFLLLSLQGLFFPVIGVFMLFEPEKSIFVLVTKIIIQSIFIYTVLKKTGTTTSAKYLIFYEFYVAFTSVLLVIYWIFPRKVEWKGRFY